VNRRIHLLTRIAAAPLILMLLVALLPGSTMVAQGPKSLYLIANHHTAQFDAWNINPDGTASYQFKVNLTAATSPSGIAIDESSNTLFLTTEFGIGGLELVDATTMATIGTAPGPGDLAGVAVDDANDIVYAVKRWTSLLYAYDWNPAGPTLTLKAGYPVTLPNCSGAFGIALDETAGILWVADADSPGIARAYNVGAWTEDTSKSFQPSHQPVDITVDSQRGFVYTVSMTYSAWTPPGTGSNFLSKYDLATSTETTANLSCQGVGVGVDEATGLVYVTVSGYSCGSCSSYGQGRLQVWDTSTGPWTQVQSTCVSASPAGICVTQVRYNPLNLSKSDGLGEDDCVYPGDNVTYQLCYDNTANTYDVHNVILEDDLPAEMNFVSATGGGSYDSGNHRVTWNLGTLTAGATQVCQDLVAQVDPSTAPETTMTDNATIDSDETGPAYASEDTDVCPNQPPVADPNGPYVVEANKEFEFDGTGSYDPDGDPLTYDWTWGDSSSSEDAGATPSHTYTEAGIYDVCLTVNDGYVDSEEVCTIAVVYDPSGGFVTGGGWIDSPAGAYTPDPDLSGKATFGFVSKYKKGADTPMGNTEFQFHAGDLNFHSDSYEWLVITVNGTRAQFKGTGTINGMGEYKFVLWAVDGDPDMFRIKIWEGDNDDDPIYDNKTTDEFGQAIAGGSIVVHKGKK
jgi:uncharacterized repeat protein (TIGR01451 family)